MSDEVGDTIKGSTKAILGSVSFISLMFGVESMMNAGWSITLPAIILFLIGIISGYIFCTWNIIQNKHPNLANSINSIAACPKTWIVLFLTVLWGIILSPFIEGHRWPFSYSVYIVSTNIPPTDSTVPFADLSLKKLLHSDFPGTLANEATFDFSGKNTPITVIDFRESHSGAEFIGAYIPNGTPVIEGTEYILNNYNSLLKQLDTGARVSSSTYGQLGTENINNTVFTKRIYIYCEHFLNIQDLAKLDTMAKSSDLNIVFRDLYYPSTKHVKLN